MPADLDSTKDVDRAARDSPAAKQNGTVRWHSDEQAEREQPRINVAADRRQNACGIVVVGSDFARIEG